MVPLKSGPSPPLPLTLSFQLRLPSARSVKFFVVIGASFSNRRQTILPSVVSKIAYVPGWRAIDYSFQKYRAWSLNLAYFFVVIGASFSNRRQTILPSVV